MSDLTIGKIFPPVDFDQGQTLDAILVPGNGLEPDGKVPPRVQARLEVGILYEKYTKLFITLSRGSAHNKKPVIVNGNQVYEAEASRNYLLDAGIPPERVIAEIYSRETLANAFYGRQITDSRHLRNLLLIVSKSHMPRASKVFEWVFQLPPDNNYLLHFLATQDIGLTSEQVQAQEEWGQTRLGDLEDLKMRIKNLDDLRKHFNSPEYMNGTETRPLPPALRSLY